MLTNTQLFVTDAMENSTRYEALKFEYGNVIGQTEQTSILLSEEDILGLTITIIYRILRLIQGGLAIFGNSLTILIIYKYEELRDNCTNIMVACLALADLLAGLAPILSGLREVLPNAPLVWKAICYIELYVNFISVLGNMYSIAFLTIDRFVYMIKPMRYVDLFTPFRGLIAVVILWLFICLKVFCLMFVMAKVDVNQPCVFGESVYMVVVTQVAIISIIVVSVYIKIGFIVSELKKNEPHISMFPPEGQEEQRNKLRERKTAKTIGLVLGTFLFCYFVPAFYTLAVLLLYQPPYPFGILIGNRIATLIYWIQSNVNPWIYGKRNIMFAKYYRKILGLNTNHIYPD